jgi:hypothetical protein
MQHLNRIVLISSFLACMGLSTAKASDGVLEISQACVTSPTGCFSGDSAGFPVTIDGSAGRSYILTSSLTVANQNTTAIQITADSVTLDLNGFTIRGTLTCNYLPYAVCSPVGTGNGVTGFVNTSVRNGTIIAMGGYGLDLSFDSVVEDVRLLGNGLGGMRVGPGSSTREVTANANNGYGILTDFRNTVHAVNATNNGAGGIKLGQSSLVRDSIVHSNNGPGIECLAGCLATGNQASGNVGAGLAGPATCASSDLSYSGNQIRGNTGGFLTGCGVQIGPNSCNGSTASCP